MPFFSGNTNYNTHQALHLLKLRPRQPKAETTLHVVLKEDPSDYQPTAPAALQAPPAWPLPAAASDSLLLFEAHPETLTVPASADGSRH
jgi:hypothetical protein